MAWTEFEEAFCHTPAKHRIMGRRMAPFSYYHLFVLRLIESPLLGLGDHGVSVADVEIASQICSISEYGKVDEMLPRWRRRARFARVNPIWWVRLWVYGRNLAKQYHRFEEYVSDYVTAPETHGDLQAGAGGESPVAKRVYERFPSPLAQVAGLIYWTKWPEEKCWMMPMGQVHWYIIAMRWYKGEDTKLVDEQDREFRAHIAAQRRNQASAGSG